ncbi:sugar transferase [Desulfomonile tiedjei]|uniref:Exopolysaccharide biosynthesis polyprenyl glycosylphosphotransferase n=1 Tax=Desulfomonile tiedjei (strain ATCC 49306 / DSM 6799 / DCB-1) TaxID=706587 RepID=I4C272_DESTA|nr:sugar transferase [Desulfomonile tiedjei]AFM23663.1 exopolysaccharide biosynthesis polyprenyl glycosylphosphotransferase [Desulfomonile tiedjei DSM 6799]
MYKQYQKYRLLLMLLDVIFTVLVLEATETLRPFLPGRFIAVGEGLPHSIVYVMVAVLWHGVFAVTGVYELRIIPNPMLQLQRMTFSYVLAVLLFTGVLFFTFREMSRFLVIYFAIANYFALVLVRLLITDYARKYCNGARAGRTLVVGASENGISFANTLMEDTAPGRILGFVDDEPPTVQPLPAPFLGGTELLTSLIKEQEIDIVVIALPEDRFGEVESIIHQVESLPVRVYVVPDTTRLTLVSSEVELLGNLLLIGIREPVIKGHRRFAKRVLDLTVSVVVLIVAWPLLFLIGVGIRIDSPGPIVYRARRVGENGRLFDMYKFRTMIVGADKLQDQVTQIDDQGRTIFKIKGDPRVTRLGKWLRRTSLDELPQVFNVLKGEMSLVGPRPEQPNITQTYDHWQWQRLSVPPGITGFWQVSGRSDLPMHLNTQYDLYYVRNYSTILDLKILLKTVGVVLKGKGAY